MLREGEGRRTGVGGMEREGQETRNSLYDVEASGIAWKKNLTGEGAYLSLQLHLNLVLSRRNLYRSFDIALCNPEPTVHARRRRLSLLLRYYAIVVSANPAVLCGDGRVGLEDVGDDDARRRLEGEDGEDANG